MEQYVITISRQFGSLGRSIAQELSAILKIKLIFWTAILWKLRTPASLMEPLKDIHLELPVIAMDGAVLYDIREKMYLHAYVISCEQSKKIE